MKYRASGIANVVVDAEDKRDAFAKAKEAGKVDIVWVEADEIRKEANEDAGHDNL